MLWWEISRFHLRRACVRDVTHVRLNKTIKAAVTFNDKEGPDESIVYTFNSDNLLKGDYFIYDNVYYLVYEDVKLTDKNLNWKKQRAVECNINFTINGTLFNAYFLSALRRGLNPDLERSTALVPNEEPLIIVPSNSLLTIGTRFNINGKPWKNSRIWWYN